MSSDEVIGGSEVIHGGEVIHGNFGDPRRIRVTYYLPLAQIYKINQISPNSMISGQTQHPKPG